MKRILAGLVLLGCGFVLLRLSQPYVRSYHFEKLLQQEVNSPVHLQTMHKTILDEARDLGFVVNDDDIHVEKILRGYVVSVHYQAAVDLRLYRTQIDFNSTARTTQEGQSE